MFDLGFYGAKAPQNYSMIRSRNDNFLPQDSHTPTPSPFFNSRRHDGQKSLASSRSMLGISSTMAYSAPHLLHLSVAEDSSSGPRHHVQTSLSFRILLSMLEIKPDALPRRGSISSQRMLSHAARAFQLNLTCKCNASVTRGGKSGALAPLMPSLRSEAINDEIASSGAKRAILAMTVVPPASLTDYLQVSVRE